MAKINLPTEILLMISGSLEDSDFLSLRRTFRVLFEILSYSLYRKYSKQGGRIILDAAFLGMVPLVQFLLKENKELVDYHQANGRTALSYAAQMGRIEVAKLLIQVKRSGVDSRNFTYCDVRYAGQSKQRIGDWKARLSRKRRNEGLKRGFDSKDSYGLTPLLYAARADKEDIVELLLATKIPDVNRKDFYGCSSLYYAAKNENQDLITLLLEKGGANVNFKGNDGRTDLSSASMYGHTRVVEQFLEIPGLEMDSQDDYGETAVSYAAKNSHKDIVKLLVLERIRRIPFKPECCRVHLDGNFDTETL